MDAKLHHPDFCWACCQPCSQLYAGTDLSHCCGLWLTHTGLWGITVGTTVQLLSSTDNLVTFGGSIYTRGWAIFFLMGQTVKMPDFVTVSVAVTSLCHCYKKTTTPVCFFNKWMCLSSNRKLFIKPGGGPAHCSFPTAYWHHENQQTLKIRPFFQIVNC